MTHRVLVTGAGSGVGNGIVKALRHSGLPLTIICSDIAPLNVGLFRADEALIWPRVEAPEAFDAITRSLGENTVDLVLIGSEYDLGFFAEHRNAIERASGARIVVSPPDTVRMANDKWLTSRFLADNGLPGPATILPEDADDAVARTADWTYPVMVKPRTGTSSRHVHMARDADDLRRLYPSVPAPIVQQMLAMPSRDFANEYTATVFKTSDSRVLGPFVARRTLRGGDSWNLEVSAVGGIDTLMTEIATALPVMGTLNVQMILTDAGPVPFEINARFSGTSAVRAHYGFNDAEMAVRDFLLGEDLPPPVIGKGMVFRYMEEVFVDGVGTATAADGFTRGEVHRWF